MLAILVSLLAALAFGAWVVALAAALSIWRLMPAGHRLKSLFSLGWLNLDSIREIAGPEADRYTKRYVYALVVFFVAIAAFFAVTVAVIVTGQNGGTP
ncbi:MAG TPA: hypothetical protein VIN06_05695 [Devosia sp.]